MKLFGKREARKLAEREPVLFPVPDPEWEGATVRLRYLDGRQRIEFAEKTLEGANGSAVALAFRNMVTLVAYCVVDDRGERAFADDDFDLLASMPTRGLKQVYQKAESINGLSLEDDTGKSEPSPS